MNLVAYAFERSQLQPGDEIVVTEMEHDSNFLNLADCLRALRSKAQDCSRRALR